MYNPRQRRDNKWEPRERATIVRVFPRFASIPSCGSDKFLEFCFSELLLYNPFRDIERDISDNNDTIISNWESLNYTPWHLE